MTEEQEKLAKEIIIQQLSLSGHTLAKLKEAGLKSNAEVQIEFFFNAPNLNLAESLVKKLSQNDCLDLKFEKSGGFFSKKYLVKGKTYPTILNEDILNQWIPWIVVQGISLDCEFDGWGAEI